MRHVLLRHEGKYGFGYWTVYDAETMQVIDTRIPSEWQARRFCERNDYVVVGH